MAVSILVGNGLGIFNLTAEIPKSESKRPITDVLNNVFLGTWMILSKIYK